MPSTLPRRVGRRGASGFASEGPRATGERMSIVRMHTLMQGRGFSRQGASLSASTCGLLRKATRLDAKSPRRVAFRLDMRVAAAERSRGVHFLAAGRVARTSLNAGEAGRGRARSGSPPIGGLGRAGTVG